MKHIYSTKQYQTSPQKRGRRGVLFLVVAILFFASNGLYAATVTAFNGVTLSGNQTICSGVTPTALSATVLTTTISSTSSAYVYVSCQWYSGTSTSTITTLISGATSLSYTPLALTTTTTTTTYYQCRIKFTGAKATGLAGTFTSTSPYVYTPANTNYVSVAITGVTAPTSTTAPTYTGGCIGSALVLTAGATSSTYTYQWQSAAKGSATFNTLNGAIGSTYTIPSAQSTDDGTQYKSVLTNWNGSCSSASITSTAKTLSVSGPTVTGPSNVTVCSGEPATFTVTNVSGYTYQWQKSTTAGGSSYSNVPTTSVPSTSGTSYSYTTPNTASSDNGYTYQCIVTSSGCQTIAGPATLTVSAPTSITTQPSAQTVCSGSPATFTVVAAGDNPTYKWQSKGTGATDLWGDISGATSANYSPTASSSNNGYSYQCIVTGSCGAAVTSDAVKLNLSTAASITTQPSDATTCSGSATTFTIVAEGTSPTYQWQNCKTPTGVFANVSGSSTNASLSITGGTANNGYYYHCKATVCGTSATSNNAKLTVSSTPTISTQPTAQSVCSGNNALFSVVASGTGLTYQWQSKTSSSASDNSYTTVQGATSSTYSVSGTSSNNGYYYRCKVSTSCTSGTTYAYSSGVPLTLYSSPSVTTSPSNMNLACVGDQAIFTVTASGSGLSFQWQKVKAGVITNITASSTITITNTSTTSVLAFTSASGDNDYTYQCLVTNSSGCTATSNPATLTMTSATASITINSTGTTTKQEVADGSTATFSVNATNSGTGTITYQWQKSTAVAGTTYADVSGGTSATYSFIPTSADSGYNYRCKMGIYLTTACAVYSTAAPLTVHASFTGTISLKASEISSSTTKYFARADYPCSLTAELDTARFFVQLDLGDEYKLGGSASYKFSESLTLTPYYSDGTPATAVSIPTLSLDLTSATPQTRQLYYVDLGLTDFIKYSYYQITFSPFIATTGTVPTDARVLAWFDVDYKVDVKSGSYTSTPLISLNAVDSSSNRVSFSWSPACSSDVNLYQIEILRIYNESSSTTSATQVTAGAIDWNKALHLDVENETSISLELNEGTGYYAWRVRPISDYYGDGSVADSRNWGVWSTCTNSASTCTISDASTIITSTSGLPNFVFYFSQQDASINSIYNRSFTEGNRISEGKIFANGLGMAKQSQRKLSELTDTILMNGTTYDFVGRPAIQSMTAPVTQENLLYKKLLLQDSSKKLYSTKDFDTEERTDDFKYSNGGDDLDVVPIWENPLKMSGPIADYYSDQNSDIAIPNAGSFPFARTLYHQDGRVKKQSLFGDEHRMGLYDTTYNGGGLQRTIRTYYSAVSDTEIMTVFGNETPFSTGIYKIIRVDPNEVPTVEYKTIDGLTIATAQLNTGPHPLLDDIWPNPTDTIRKKIDGFSMPDPYTIVKEQSVSFVEPTVMVSLHYFLDANTFNAYCVDYCSSCDYTVYLYIIREETDELKWSKTFTIGADACSVNNDIITDNLGADAPLWIMLSDPGSYRFGRRISVNNIHEGEEHYADYHADSIGTIMDSTQLNLYDQFNAYLDGTVLDDNGDTLAANLDSLNAYLDDLAESTGAISGNSGLVKSGGLGVATNLSASVNISNITSNLFSNTDDVTVTYTEGTGDDPEDDDFYTIETSCCSVNIPKVTCNEDLCDDYWITRDTLVAKGISTFQDWETAAFADHGGYYDFENKMLYDTWGSKYGNTLDKYFYDKYGNSIYTQSYSASITISGEYGENMHYSMLSKCNDSGKDQEKITIKVSSTSAKTGDIASITNLSPTYNTCPTGECSCGGSYTYQNATVTDFAKTIVNKLNSEFQANGYGSYFEAVSSGGVVTIQPKSRLLGSAYYLSVTFTNFTTNATEQLSKATDFPSISTSTFPFATGALNAMLNHMMQDETGSKVYSCTDVLLGMQQFTDQFEDLYETKGTASAPGVDFLDYLLELCGGKQYSGYADHEYGTGDANAYLISSSGISAYSSTSSSSRDYGYGYLEYAYKSFLLDPYKKLDDKNAGTITSDQYDAYTTCIKNSIGNSNSGKAYEKSISTWSNPNTTDNSASADSVWNDSCSTSGEAWYYGDAVIPDYRDEYVGCKAWERLYTCVNTDIVADLNYSQEFKADGVTTATACSTAVQDKFLSNLGQIVDMQENRYKHILSNNVTSLTISPAATTIYTTPNAIGARYLKNNIKTSYVVSSAFDGTASTSLYNGTSYSTTTVDKFKDIMNLIAGDIEVATTNSSAAYTHYTDNFSGTLAEFVAKCANDSVSTSTTYDELNTYLNNIAADFSITAITSAMDPVAVSSAYLTFTKGVSLTAAIGVVGCTRNTISASGSKIQLNSTKFGSTTTTDILDLGADGSSTITVPTIYYKPKSISQKTIGILAKHAHDCNQDNIDYVSAILQSQLALCRQNEIDSSLVRYNNHCTMPDSIKDSLYIDYGVSYEHFTLFYYDKKGNLVKTVPPAGVDRFDYAYDSNGKKTNHPSRTDVKKHQLATEYRYNSLGQRTYESTPDGGVKQFWYNSVGQLRFSQNAKQATDVSYSYLKYDALGRITESGLSYYDALSQSFASNVDDDTYPPSYSAYRTVTVYDDEVSGLSYKTDGSTLTQHYLQNRISYAYSDPDGTDKNGDENYTYYSYDPHGNVEWMLQSIDGLGNNKYLAYEYDLISGKITKVKYNEGMNDQFFYRYTYDSDNRIEKIETSRDNYLWDKDAQYQYYAYGPLKRLSIGEDKIQGLDYVYTINGWLKSINHPSLSSAYDPGKDGSSTATYPADVFGMTMGYFDGDFKRKYGSTQSPFNSTYASCSYTDNSAYTSDTKYNHEWYVFGCGKNENSLDANGNATIAVDANKVNYRPLFNGSITNITYNQTQAGATMQLGGYISSFMYNYDELYRLTNASFDYYDANASKNKWHRDDISTAYNAYKSNYSYDENGNIKTLDRYTFTSSGVQIDGLTYNYRDANGDGVIDNNKLNSIDDSKTSASLTSDLEDQSANNYQYDDIGQLISDAAEGISTIEWAPSGKIARVIYSQQHIITFTYDALGNRVSKTVLANGATTNTYYVPNATGATMAIYTTSSTSTDAELSEIPLYGTSRIGEFAPGNAINDDNNDLVNGITTFTRIAGNKKYELDDYLGNVRAVVSDLKTPSGTTYTTNATVSNDYYPFGMLLPSRNTGETAYRFGYQGKEHDDELKSTANSYDFGARMYDPRVGRWLSMDPLQAKYPDLSPYNFCANDPVNLMDPDGNEIHAAYIQDRWGRNKYVIVTSDVLDHQYVYNRLTKQWTVVDTKGSGTVLKDREAVRSELAHMVKVRDASGGCRFTDSEKSEINNVMGFINEDSNGGENSLVKSMDKELSSHFSIWAGITLSIKGVISVKAGTKGTSVSITLFKEKDGETDYKGSASDDLGKGGYIDKGKVSVSNGWLEGSVSTDGKIGIAIGPSTPESIEKATGMKAKGQVGMDVDLGGMLEDTYGEFHDKSSIDQERAGTQNGYLNGRRQDVKGNE